MRRILVVVDMQHDFIDGALGTPEAEAVIEHACEKIRTYDASDIFVTMDTHNDSYPDTQEGRLLPVTHCIRGTHGWELDPRIKEAVRGAKVYEKPGFGSVALALDLALIAATEEIAIELIGLCTDICVVTNALTLKSHLPEVPISVDGSACAGTTVEMHEAALQTMRSCQIHITE